MNIPETMPRLAAAVYVPLALLACLDPGTVRPRDPDIEWAVMGLEPSLTWAGTPAVLGSTVFFDVESSIRAYDVATGRERWRTAIRSTNVPVSRMLTTGPSTVYVSHDTGVIALDAATGAIRWRRHPDGWPHRAMGIADERAYYTGTRQSAVYALRASDGGILWSRDLTNGWVSGNVMGVNRAGDTLFVAGSFRRLDVIRAIHIFVVALHRVDGRELWRYETPDTIHVTDVAPALSRDFLLIADAEGHGVIMLDRATGTHAWTYRTAPGYLGPIRTLTVENEILYFGAGKPDIVAVDLANRRTRWEAPVGTSPNEVVVCKNRVFGEILGIAIVDRSSGQLLRTLLTDEFEPGGLITSGLATDGQRVFASGTRGIYAFRC